MTTPKDHTATQGTSERSEREAFERWALSEEGGWWPEALAREPDGRYHARALEENWIGWRARAAIADNFMDQPTTEAEQVHMRKINRSRP